MFFFYPRRKKCPREGFFSLFLGLLLGHFFQIFAGIFKVIFLVIKKIQLIQNFHIIGTFREEYGPVPPNLCILHVSHIVPFLMLKICQNLISEIIKDL